MLKDILHNKYKISIIIPVYNTEKYFARCIESVMMQSYKNLEIIIVDDCSKGNIKQIAQEYINKDNRIRLISHENNKGLFQARVTGAGCATGDYIVFLDSDDYVSLDYYHTLLNKIVTEQADISIGHTVHEQENGYRYIFNFHDAFFNFNVLEDDEVKSHFFGQQGLCYGWHTVWNKMYSRKLWDICIPYYKMLQEHIIMTEDIAFSSLLFYNAKKITTVQNDAYFYCENANASTDANNITMEKYEKNIHDMSFVFQFVEDYLENVGAQKKIKEDFHEFRKLYARIWRNIPCYQMTGADAKKAESLLEEFCPDESGVMTKDDNFFSLVRTQWRGGLEDFKEKIIRSSDEYVSFDIFDTLVNRPFYHPEDLFSLIDRDFEQLVNCNMSFKKMRIAAEAMERKRCYQKNPKWQDVTLDEIYNCIEDLYHLPHEIVSELMKREKELELEFSGQRNAGKELYEVALLTGKKVILISDMYLVKNTIEDILNKHNYSGYDKLYLSSDVRLTKNSGDLFKYVVKDLKLRKGFHIYHIGDTWNNDYVNSEKAGFSPLFFPKAKEVFENKINGVCTNNLSSMLENSSGNIMDTDKINDSMGQGILYALVYNKYFDNPYRTFNPESDFNIDPYLIGYYTLGMHLIGLAFWINKTCKEKNVSKIHFLARDGYMPKKAYDILFGTSNKKVASNYLYASRKSVMTGMIKSKIDFYGLPIEYRNHSPKTLLEILEFAFKHRNNSEMLEMCRKHRIDYEKTFDEKEEYFRFIDFFLEFLYDEDIFKQNRKLAEEYYSIIKEDDITFDMGYSGKIQNAITNLIGHKVDVMFVHSDNESYSKMKRIGDFNISNLYDYTPVVSGLLREHMLSDYSSGCIGYKEIDGKVVPLFDNEIKTLQDRFVISLIQKGAMDLVNLFSCYFSKYADYIPLKSFECSLLFEGFLRNSKEIDRKIFAASYFEDLVYGANSQINIFDFLNSMYEELPKNEGKTYIVEKGFVEQRMEEKGKIKRAIIFLLLDKKVAITKLRKDIKRIKFQLYRRLE